MTTSQLRAQQSEIDDQLNRMTGLVVSILIGAGTLASAALLYLAR